MNIPFRNQATWGMELGLDQLMGSHMQQEMKQRPNNDLKDDGSPKCMTWFGLRWVGGWAPKT